MIRALLIDDEPGARADLRRLLAAHSNVLIVGEAASVRSARERLAAEDYDLVFLDIQILGGSGFDVVPSVRPGARIIFATAHNAFALRAFEVNALDYLLKPIKAERLASALGRLAPPSAEPPTPALGVDALSAEDLVQLASPRGARFAPVAEFCAIVAEENYSRVHLADGTNHLIRRALKAWEDVLPTTLFRRVHRTAIANLSRITGFQRESPKDVSLRIAGVQVAVPVSRERWPELKGVLPAWTA